MKTATYKAENQLELNLAICTLINNLHSQSTVNDVVM